MPRDFPARLQALSRGTGSSTSTTRCSPGSGGRGRSGRSSTTASRRISSCRGSRSVGPAAGGRHRARRRDGRRLIRAGSEARSAGARFPVQPPSPCSTRSRARRSGSAPTRWAHCFAVGSRDRGRVETIGEVRGLGPMLALELVTDRTTKEPAGDAAKQTTELARERGLVLLTCGLYGNVDPRARADPRGRRGRRGRALDPGGRACRCKRRSVLARTLRKPASTRPTSGS